MRKITKGDEPVSFTEWRQDKPPEQDMNDRFKQIHTEERWDILRDLRRSCAAEQYSLCCYCCGSISDDSFRMNEHVKARNAYPEQSLDYGNIAASCKNRNQCDKAHGDQELPLTPFMDECEIELEFYISGRVKGRTPRAEETIRVLNLGDNEANNERLITQRKAAIEALLGKDGYTADNWQLEDDDILEMMLDDLDTPENGKLEPYAPVLQRILEGWLNLKQ